MRFHLRHRGPGVWCSLERSAKNHSSAVSSSHRGTECHFLHTAPGLLSASAPQFSAWLRIITNLFNPCRWKLKINSFSTVTSVDGLVSSCQTADFFQSYCCPHQKELKTPESIQYPSPLAFLQYGGSDNLPDSCPNRWARWNEWFFSRSAWHQKRSVSTSLSFNSNAVIS